MPHSRNPRCAPLAAWLLGGLVGLANLMAWGCSDDDDDARGYEVPLDPGSPWPKFRRTARQDGRSPVRPTLTGGLRWSFQTGKGIFSSPVVGADGTIYIGSADRYFYAIWPVSEFTPLTFSRFIKLYHQRPLCRIHDIRQRKTMFE